MRLLDQLMIATEEYYAALKAELEHYRSVLHTADYEELRKGVEQARRFAELARRSLRRHVAVHRCGSS